MAVVGRVLSMGANTTPVQQPLLNLPMAQAQSWEGTFPQAQQAPYQRQQSQQIHPMYNQQMQRKLNTHPGMVRQASEEDVGAERRWNNYCTPLGSVNNNSGYLPQVQAEYCNYSTPSQASTPYYGRMSYDQQSSAASEYNETHCPMQHSPTWYSSGDVTPADQCLSVDTYTRGRPLEAMQTPSSRSRSAGSTSSDEVEISAPRPRSNSLPPVHSA